MSDLLLRAVFEEHEIFFLQPTHYACGILLQHQRIDGDEIDINLDDIRRRERRHPVCITWIRAYFVRVLGICLSTSAVRAYSSLARLARDPQREEEESERKQNGQRNQKQKRYVRGSCFHKLSPVEARPRQGSGQH